MRVDSKEPYLAYSVELRVSRGIDVVLLSY